MRTFARMLHAVREKDGGVRRLVTSVAGGKGSP
jgi:hypothetical protein